MAISLMNDSSKVRKTPQRVFQSHLFGSFTFGHNFFSTIFMWVLESSALCLLFPQFTNDGELHQWPRLGQFVEGYRDVVTQNQDTV